MTQMTEAYSTSSKGKNSASDPSATLLMNWTIGQILRANPHNKLRKQFLNDPYLDQITLGELLSVPFAMANFLENCRKIPHCGDTSLKRLRETVEMAANGQIFQSRG
jgi:hypothetical protein